MSQPVQITAMSGAEFMKQLLDGGKGKKTKSAAAAVLGKTPAAKKAVPTKTVAVAALAPTAKVVKAVKAVKVAKTVKTTKAANAVKAAPVKVAKTSNKGTSKAAKAPAAKNVATTTTPVPPAAPPTPIPFTLTNGKYVFIIDHDMYGHYDRMGEGVMYRAQWVFDPAFFAPNAKAWDPTLVSFELVGFNGSDEQYLESYGASAKRWESEVLSCWKSDVDNFMNDCFYEQLSSDQNDLFDGTSPHGAASLAGTDIKNITAILKAAVKNRAHK